MTKRKNPSKNKFSKTIIQTKSSKQLNNPKNKSGNYMLNP